MHFLLIEHAYLAILNHTLAISLSTCLIKHDKLYLGICRTNA